LASWILAMCFLATNTISMISHISYAHTFWKPNFSR
jgi:hypothetical protein